MARTIGLTFSEAEQPLENAVTYPDTPIDKWTVIQLKRFAEDNGIDIGNATKKDDIIKAILSGTDDNVKLDDTEQ